MTSTRLAWLVFIVVMIALVSWIAHHSYWTEVKVQMPPKGEALTNPFYAVQRFAQALGAHAQWNRGISLPPTNGVVFISAWDWDLTSDRRQRIEHWVESGGRLVVDKSLISSTDAFEKWSGIGEEIAIAPERNTAAGAPTTRCYTLDEKVDSHDSYTICG